jgi:hypothetical protein
VFGKNEKSNITDKEEKALKAFGKGLMSMNKDTLESAVTKGKLQEVRCVSNH